MRAHVGAAGSGARAHPSGAETAGTTREDSTGTAQEQTGGRRGRGYEPCLSRGVS